MVIYSPGSMPEERLIQTMNLEDIPSVRRNPVIADIFAQLGYMERKGSGMGAKSSIQSKPFLTLKKRCFQPSSPTVPSLLSHSLI